MGNRAFQHHSGTQKDIKDFSISRALPAPSSTTMFTIRVNGSHRAGASEGYRKLKDQGGNLTTAGKTQKGGSRQTGFGERRHLQVYPDRLGRGFRCSGDGQVLVCSSMEPDEQLCAWHGACASAWVNRRVPCPCVLRASYGKIFLKFPYQMRKAGNFRDLSS